MAPLHRPQSAFELHLHHLRAEAPRHPLSALVQEVLEELSSSVEGLSEPPEPPEFPHHVSPGDDSIEPGDVQALMEFMTQAMVVRTYIADHIPRVLALFADPENFDVDELLSEDGVTLIKPYVYVWAEFDEDGTLEVYWDDDDWTDFLEPPVAAPDAERENLLLRVDARLWKVVMPEDASEARKTFSAIVPYSMLDGLRLLLNSLAQPCQLVIGEWPKLTEKRFRLEDDEDRYLRLLFSEAATAKRNLAVMTQAAERALQVHGIQGVTAFTRLRAGARKAGKRLAAEIAANSGKSCSEAQVRKLTEYVSHVEDASKLVKAFYAVAKAGGLSKEQLEVGLPPDDPDTPDVA